MLALGTATAPLGGRAGHGGTLLAPSPPPHHTTGAGVSPSSPRLGLAPLLPPSPPPPGAPRGPSRRYIRAGVGGSAPQR